MTFVTNKSHIHIIKFDSLVWMQEVISGPTNLQNIGKIK